MNRLLLLVMIATATGSILILTPRSQPKRAAPLIQWSLIWSDEFNGAGAVDGSDWIYDNGTAYGGPSCPANWGTGEVEVMSSNTDNVFQGSGNLNIRALHSGSNPTSGWTSGRIETVRTDFQPPPGGAMAVEARLQQPNVDTTNGLGYWPAFWMLGAPFRGNCPSWPSIGEIDIMEDINGRSSEFATMHCGSYPAGPCNEPTGLGSGERSCPGCQTGFHIYRVEVDKSVSPEEIRWYLDGANFFTLRSNQVDATTWNNATNHGFFIIFDLAIGGGFPAAFGGGPTGATISGQSLVVDYVRVYYSSATPTPTATATPTSTPTPGVQFSASTYSVSEGGGTTTITVNRTGDTSTAVSVRYATSDGTAKEGKDYTSAFGVLNFAAGETSKTFTVLIIDNAFAAGTRTVNLTLSSLTGATLAAQSTAVLSITDNDTSNGPTNPIDQSRFFVQLHYFDFLGRYPDQGGWDFWTSNIDNCTPKPSCVDAQRINTSAAYFLSIEFQQTGYLVERIYRTAYGSGTGTSTFGGTHQFAVPVVRFSEFLPDTQQIGAGVVVGQGDWQTALENNKQAFTNDFVQRSRFTTAFPTTMTPAQFVDKLNQNAGGVLSASDRTTLIALFGSATDTSNTTARAQAVRQVAENATLNTQEFNRAFVLMQYFGYLRRDPNGGQDTDYTGFDFWLTKLNQFNGNYNAAEMVKAFITSTEYRQRFGP